MFAQQLNRLTGEAEWVTQDDTNSDNAQQLQDLIVHSQYLDMINDQYRNWAYDEAIRQVVLPEDKILDIGTGSGLLAMMAAKNIQQKSSNQHKTSNEFTQTKQIIACEVFPPMAKLAQKIITQNRFQDTIEVREMRSDDLEVKNAKFDVIVMEIFDSELLGEGVLITMEHAVRQLLKEGGKVIPYKGVVWGQIVQCEELWKTRNIDSIQKLWMKNSQSLSVDSFNESFYPLHVNPLFPDKLKAISNPVKLFEFEFDRKIEKDQMKNLDIFQFEFSAQGIPHALILWWDLVMVRNSDLIISTRPMWIKNISIYDQDNTIPSQEWRNHWQQIWTVPSDWNTEQIYLPGESISVTIGHDETNFFVKSAADTSPLKDNLNLLLSSYFKPLKSGQLFDQDYIEAFDNSIQSAIAELNQRNEKFVVLVTGLNPIAIMRLLSYLQPENLIYIVKEDREFETVLQRLVSSQSSNSQPKIELISWQELQSGNFTHVFDLVVSEPFFRDNASQPPWYQLRFWHRISILRNTNIVNNYSKIIPCKGVLKCVGANLPDYYRTQQQMNQVFGTNLSEINNLIQNENVIFSGIPWQLGNNFVEVTERSKILEFDFGHSWENDVAGCAQLDWVNQSQFQCQYLLFWIDYQYYENQGEINQKIGEIDMGATNIGIIAYNEHRDGQNEQGIKISVALQRLNGELKVTFA
eukprot:TRINITY_DN16479_c1_g2_i3.p1 TRINITY_DN16479_c1_g2~~TRINITY_DN16479_c1_g2_i3.p1  ORF type:complete len:727 (+),score=46.49 TRINITY_DN16479_c1_g2_i3:107-2182(+)